MNAKEELTKLLMESYDRGVKDAKQEALAALEKVVVKLKAERKPLTDKTITKVIDSMPKKMKGFMVDWDLYKFTRAIEAKHDIKENKHDATTE